MADVNSSSTNSIVDQITQADTPHPEIHRDQSGPTWTPVIYFAGGRVLKLKGRLPHDKAMAIAEQEALQLDDAESFGAQRAR